MRDRDLDRVAGLLDDDDGDDALEWTPAAFSTRLRDEWSGLSMADRMNGLRAELAAKFLRRFGFPWDGDRMTPMTQDPPWPPKRMPWTRARGFESRSRLVLMLDHENQIGLLPRADGSARFLSVLEYTWLSIMGGNWPEAARRRAPDEVLAAEREVMKKAIARYGQKPAEWLGAKKLRRGPRAREK